MEAQQQPSSAILPPALSIRNDYWASHQRTRCFILLPQYPVIGCACTTYPILSLYAPTDTFLIGVHASKHRQHWQCIRQCHAQHKAYFSSPTRTIPHLATSAS